MDARLHSLDTADLDAVLAGFGAERTMPSAAYTEPGVYDWELEALWDLGWVCIGRTSDFPEGTVSERRVGDESLVVTRSDGDLAVMHNVCRHRGHEILGAGERRATTSLRCPYHGWLYRLDGSLRAAPKMSHRDDLDGIRLVEVRSTVWNEWVFVTFSQGGTFDEYAGNLDAAVAPWRPADLVPGATLTYDVAANWKFLHENYHECYHCASIHPELTAVANPECSYNLTPTGAWVGGSLTLRDGSETLSIGGRTAGRFIEGLSDQRRREALYVGLIPNLLIALHPDYVLTHRLEPVEPGRTLVYCEWLFPAEAVSAEGFDPAYAVEIWDVTNRQDFTACESMQRNARSRGYLPGVLSEGEDAVYQFLAMIAGAYLGKGLEPVANPHRANS